MLIVLPFDLSHAGYSARPYYSDSVLTMSSSAPRQVIRYSITVPPSTMIVCPVTKRLASDAR